MKYLFPALYLVISSISISSCSTGPDFNRNNTKDPESDYYVPILPENSPVSIALDDSRNVILSWDKEEYQDGVVVSKKYQPNSPLVVLDTLYGTPLSFIDHSGVFISGTTYQVDFFRVLDDSSLVFNSESSFVSIKIQPFESMTISYYDGLGVRAEYGRPEVGMFRYFDGIEVLVNTTLNSETPTWDTLATLDRTHYSNEYFRTDISFDLFDLHVKVNQFIIDSSGVKIPLQSVTWRNYINPIEKFDYSFIDELTLKLQWSHNTDFADGYIINSNDSWIDTVYGTSIRSYTLSFTDAPDYPVDLSIKAFVGDNVGKSLSTSRNRYPNVQTPEIYTVKPIDQHSVELSWYNWFADEESYIAGYIIEQSRPPENTYTPIDTVSPEKRSYLVTDMDPNFTYNFAVHSYTSDWSRYITLDYRNTFVSYQSNQLEVPGNNITYSKSGKYMAKHVPETSTSFNDGFIYVKNQNTGEEYLHEMPYYNDHHRPRIIDFVISEINNTIIYLGDNDSIDNSGEYISIYDFENEEFVLEHKTLPGYGRYSISLLSDDETIVISKNDAIVTYDAVNGQIVNEISSSNDYDTILRPYNDTAIKCSKSGIFEYDLTNGDLINQSNEYCYRGSINESANLLTFENRNSIKVLDLNTFSIISTIEDDRIEWGVTFNFWFFEEDNLLIYEAAHGIYNGYHISQNNKFAFTIPNYTEYYIYANIRDIKKETDGSYTIITYDGEHSYRYEEGWSLIRKQPYE